MSYKPAKLIQTQFITNGVNANWTNDDSTGDPWIGYPYRWDATLNVSAQSHGSHETPTQFFYDGNDVKVGDFVITSGEGAIVKIVSISAQSSSQVTCVVEDYDRINIFQDSTQTGSGGIPDGDGYIFEVQDGVPILFPMPLALASAIPPHFSANLFSRFFKRKEPTDLTVDQVAHGFSVGQAIRLTSSGAYALAQADTFSNAEVIGFVTEVGVPGPDRFKYKPVGPIVYATMPAGNPGSDVFVSDSVAGGFTTTPPPSNQRRVFIKVDGNTGIYVGSAAKNISGPQGSTGASGPQGTAGSNGTNGVQGPTGSNGTNGTQGPAGSNGTNGVQGPAGTNGADGVQGATGANGTNGTQGPAGSNGTNGVQGPAGSNGTNGVQGATGPAGATGNQGSTGPIGPTGVQGVAGTNGVQGATGANGTQGPAGTNGTNGVQGPAGSNGTNGVQGPAGTNGTNGAQGATGPTGATGNQGATGPIGPAGVQGATGSGVQGAQGPLGPTSDGSFASGFQDYTSGTHYGFSGAMGIIGFDSTSVSGSDISVNGTGFSAPWLYNFVINTTGNYLISYTIGSTPDPTAFPVRSEIRVNNVALPGSYVDGSKAFDPTSPSPNTVTLAAHLTAGDVVRLYATTDGNGGYAQNQTLTIARLAVGSQGPTGATGTGVQGPAGSNGTNGVQGPAGSNGTNGVQGPAGTNGTNGVQGPAGTNGTNGVQGPAGADGSNGTQGPAGATGVQGATGSGVQGAMGPQGFQGSGALSNGVAFYTFDVNFGAGGSPSSVSNLPSGWSSGIATNDVTITHTTGLIPKMITYLGLNAGVYHARFPTSTNEWTMTSGSETSQFTIRVTNTVVGSSTNSSAKIIVMF